MPQPPSACPSQSLTVPRRQQFHSATTAFAPPILRSTIAQPTIHHNTIRLGGLAGHHHVEFEAQGISDMRQLSQTQSECLRSGAAVGVSGRLLRMGGNSPETPRI